MSTPRPDDSAVPETAARPLGEWPIAEAAQVTGVLTDIDDTLTQDGAIMPAALAALVRLRDAGLPVVAITGRPMGWSEPFASTWPVDAIVAENGAVALIPGPAGLRTEFLQEPATRERNTLRLRAAAADIVATVPGATLARDSAGRVTDIAIDHSEFTRLDSQRIAQVVERMRSHGMRATVSSIHINGWFGDHDKWRGACWIVQRLFGRDLAAEPARWLYVGDSTNDQVMFERLPQSIGVANVIQFAPLLEHWPAYVADKERGDGFAEVVAALLAARPF